MWYAYLNGAEGNKKATHSKSVRFSDSFKHAVSGYLMMRSNTGAETSLIVSESEPNALPHDNLKVIKDTEIQATASDEEPEALSNHGTPETPESHTVSCFSPYRFDLFEDPANMMGETKKDGCCLKSFICLFERTYRNRNRNPGGINCR